MENKPVSNEPAASTQSKTTSATTNKAQPQNPDDVTTGDTWGDQSIGGNDGTSTNESQPKTDTTDDERRKLFGKGL